MLVAGVVVALAILPLLGYFVARPMKSVIPLYALSVPVGDAIRVPVPLPAPFDTVSSMLGGLALAAIVTHLVVYRDARVPTLPVAAWIAFLSWAIATVLWAIGPYDAINTLTIAIPLILLMVGASLLPWQRSDLALLKTAIVVSGIVVAAYALSILLTGQELPTHGVGVRFSVVSDPEETDPNLLAASLLLPFALALELALTKSPTKSQWRVPRVLGTAGSLLCPIAIVLTGSRGGLISAAAVLVLTAYFCARIPQLRGMVVRMVVSIVLLIMVLAYLYQVVEYVAPGFRDSIASFDPIARLTAPESSGRVQIWSTGYLACKEYCDYGAGIGNFNNAYQEFYPYSGVLGNIGLARPAHNTYLQLVVETGIVGLALFIVALLVEWRSLTVPQVVALAPSLKATMAAILVAEFFLTAVWFKFFWLVFIVARATERAAGAEGLDLSVLGWAKARRYATR